MRFWAILGSVRPSVPCCFGASLPPTLPKNPSACWGLHVFRGLGWEKRGVNLKMRFGGPCWAFFGRFLVDFSYFFGAVHA